MCAISHSKIICTIAYIHTHENMKLRYLPLCTYMRSKICTTTYIHIHAYMTLHIHAYMTLHIHAYMTQTYTTLFIHTYISHNKASTIRAPLLPSPHFQEERRIHTCIYDSIHI